MKAWEVQGRGIESLKLVERPKPEEIADNQILVNIKAASLNYRDLIMLNGGYGHLGGIPPFVPISDAAGIVVSIGKNVTKFKMGDEVISSFFRNWRTGSIKKETAASALGGKVDGVMQEFMVFDEDELVNAPQNWSLLESSTLPCAAVTAWRALITEGNLSDKSIVLTQGLGGVSIFSIQIAKSFGAKVISTTSSEERIAVAKEIGSDEAINYNKNPEWYKDVLSLSGHSGVDIVVEVGGAQTLDHSIRCSKQGAIIAIIGVLSGGVAELSIGRAISKSSRMIGITCGTTEELSNVSNQLAKSGFKPIIDSKYTLNELPNALAYMREGKHVGKIVIEF